MARPISIFTYIAENNPDGVDSLLLDSGIKTNLKSNKQRADFLKSVAKKIGTDEDFMTRLYSIHPDKKFFEQILKFNNNTSNSADGDSLYASGDIDKQNKKIRFTKIALGGLLALGLAITIVSFIPSKSNS